MPRPTRSNISHHVFNFQEQSNYSPLVYSTFYIGDTKFSDIAMLDSGCSTCIIPASQLPDEAKKHIKRSDVKVRGINGSITALGQLTCDIVIGNQNTPAFCGINALITAQSTPILIGQNILCHDTLISYTVDNEKAKVEFKRTLAQGGSTHTANIVRQTSSPNSPTGDSQTKVIQDYLAIGPHPELHTLDEKLTWLKHNTGLTLPNHPNRDELEATTNLLIRYADIIGTENGDKGTFIRPIRIPTNGQSRSQKQHPIAQALEEEVNAEIGRMASKGIIEACSDPKGFNSPVFAVRKKNGSIRVVANFKRTLNKVLVDLDPYPIPRMDHLLNKIGKGNRYFASLDLRSGYWQIEIDEQDRHKTAFTWKDKCYQYTRLAFGLTSAGQIFSRCVAEALATVTSRSNISSYIDDNLVHAKTFKEYIIALEQLFMALQKFGLKLNPDKCSFLAPEAKFLGRIINSEGFKADPEYVRAIGEMKPPTSRKELQSLIGRLVWIRQFLETRLHEQIRSSMFSKLMAPIHELNKVNKPFHWTENADRAFRKIKDRLSSPPVISFPDFSMPFTLTTDASDVACGAILMQESSNGKKNIVGVASHSFNTTEQNWSTTEREAYAVKWAILKFDYFLRNRPFVVFTDHKSLTYLDQREFNNAKIRRWQDEISCYKFVLEYVEGESNVWADMLSRGCGQKKIKTPSDPNPAGRTFILDGSSLRIYVPSWCINDIDSLKLIPKMHTPRNAHTQRRISDAFFAYHTYSSIPAEQICEHLDIATEQQKDETLAGIIHALQTSYPDGPQIDPDDHRAKLFKRKLHQFFLEPGTTVLMIRDHKHSPRLVVPYKLRPKYLHQAHDANNHSGITRMQELLSGYWWESKNNDIKAYADSCITCAKCKGNYGRRTRWPMGHCKRGKRPFELVFVDFVTMSNSKGKRYILTILDSFSRHLTAIPCARDRAIDAARGLYQFFLRHREIPRIVSSDRGTHFTGEVYRQFCEQMAITQELHCPWRPQSSGNIERQHRTMKNAIYMLCEDRNCEWTDVLESVVSSMNATINNATGVSPHFTVTGRHPSIGLPTLHRREARSDDPGAYGMQINALLRQVHHRVALANDEADHKMENREKHFSHKNPLQVGDKVLLHRPQSATAKSTHMQWIGSFTITKTNSLMYQVQDESGITTWVHRAHIRRIAPRPPHLSITNLPPPPSITDEQHSTNGPTCNPDENRTPSSQAGQPRRLPARTTRGQLPTRFRDFIM